MPAHAGGPTRTEGAWSVVGDACEHDTGRSAGDVDEEWIGPAAAGVGEVLVSSIVRDLVAGSGIDFESRGEHELKGVRGPTSLYTAVSAT